MSYYWHISAWRFSERSYLHVSRSKRCNEVKFNGTPKSRGTLMTPAALRSYKDNLPNYNLFYYNWYETASTQTHEAIKNLTVSFPPYNRKNYSQSCFWLNKNRQFKLGCRQFKDKRDFRPLTQPKNTLKSSQCRKQKYTPRLRNISGIKL